MKNDKFCFFLTTYTGTYPHTPHILIHITHTHTYRIALSLFLLSIAIPPNADNKQLKYGIKNNSALLCTQIKNKILYKKKKLK